MESESHRLLAVVVCRCKSAQVSPLRVTTKQDNEYRTPPLGEDGGDDMMDISRLDQLAKCNSHQEPTWIQDQCGVPSITTDRLATKREHLLGSQLSAARTLAHSSQQGAGVLQSGQASSRVFLRLLSVSIKGAQTRSVPLHISRKASSLMPHAIAQSG